MTPEMLYALRDQAGVPSHPVVFLILGVLTFALHIAAVQVGGSGFDPCDQSGVGQDQPRLDRLARAVQASLRPSLPVSPEELQVAKANMNLDVGALFEQAQSQFSGHFIGVYQQAFITAGFRALYHAVQQLLCFWVITLFHCQFGNNSATPVGITRRTNLLK